MRITAVLGKLRTQASAREVELIVRIKAVEEQVRVRLESTFASYQDYTGGE